MRAIGARPVYIYIYHVIFVIITWMMTNIYTGIWVRRVFLFSAAWCPCCASRRPPFAISGPRWIDIASSKAFKAVGFLNDGNKRESDLAEWITRGKKNALSRGTVKLLLKCIVWKAVYWEDTGSIKVEYLKHSFSEMWSWGHGIEIA